MTPPPSRGGSRGGRGHSDQGRPGRRGSSGPRQPAGTSETVPRGDADLPDPSQGDARDRVHARLIRIARKYPDLPIGSVNVSRLEPRDAAFAKALEQIVLQRWNTLHAIAASRVDRDWRILQSSIRTALLAGTAELLFMETVPDHAAINETVTRVRRHVHQGAAGLVNAVLRKIAGLRGETLPADHPDARNFHEHRDLVPLSDGRAIRLTEPVFDADEVVRLAQQTSHGEPLVVHWISAHGLAKAREICHHDLVRPPLCVTASDPATLEPYTGPDGPLVPHDRFGYFVVNTEKLDLRAFLAEDPTRRVQDPASAEPVAGTSGLRPRLIVDFCAGRGTKTRQLAETHPEAEILATDVDRTRFEDLRRVFADHPRVKVLPPNDLGEAMGRTDLLVLDVPCSNTGVLPRRAEARYRFDPDTLRSIASLQREIVRETEPFLAPRGAILFATCSLEPLENRRMAAWMSRRFGLSIRNESQSFPAGIPGDPPTSIHDGSFHAVLVREEDSEPGKSPTPSETR